MTILYNCHSDSSGYRITKFNDGEVESSYICSTDACECPAGVRTTCRHRQMLPLFIDRGAVDSFWFLDWQRKGWVSNEPSPLEIDNMVVLPDDITSDGLAEEFYKLLHPTIEERSEPYDTSSSTASILVLPENVAVDVMTVLVPCFPEPPTKPSWRRI